MALSSIDLFTGIGGITQALHGIAHPVAYCDVDPETHIVLKRLMARGKLPVCPISSDVKTLNKVWLIRHGVKKKPHMICGGFPCTSVSLLGNKDGFNNTIDGSGLFFEILRLADELQTPILFLENVQNILNMEMDAIVRELVNKRGYNVRWCVNSAQNMGAPHQRKRWFCLAYKESIANKSIPVAAIYKPFNWNERHEPERTICDQGKEGNKMIYKRHAMLGNSVVPDAVRYAFMYLWNGMHEAPQYTESGALSLRDPAEANAKTPKQSKAKGSNKWPKCGYVMADKPHDVHPIEFVIPHISSSMRYKRVLTFDPSVYKPNVPPGGNLKLEILSKPEVHKAWSTLRRGATRASNYITRRTVRDLPTQVRYEVGTKNRECPVNPIWTEYMMGYEKAWTAF
jgi:site-specific DNA-cytosine methylase